MISSAAPAARAVGRAWLQGSGGVALLRRPSSLALSAQREIASRIAGTTGRAASPARSRSIAMQ